MARFIPKHVKQRKPPAMVNGALLMPVSPAARLKRSKTCSNCGAHALPPVGTNTPLLECRLDPPSMVMAPMGNGRVQPTSIFKAVEPDWWCKKWSPLIEEVASLGEVAAHVGSAK